MDASEHPAIFLDFATSPFSEGERSSNLRTWGRRLAPNLLCTCVSAYSHAQSVVRCYGPSCPIRADRGHGRRKEAYSITFRNWWTNGQLRDLLNAIVKDKWWGSDYVIDSEPWRCRTSSRGFSKVKTLNALVHSITQIAPCAPSESRYSIYDKRALQIKSGQSSQSVLRESSEKPFPIEQCASIT